MNRKKYFFSLIVPSYNSGKTLDKTLDSLIAQSFNNFEIILIDDYSSDLNSYEIAKKYSKKYFNIKLFKMEENMGAPHCMNFGVNKATGSWIGIIDSDALYPNDWLQKILCEISENTNIIGGPYKHPDVDKGYFKKVFHIIESLGFPRHKIVFDKYNNYTEPCLGGGNFFFNKNVFNEIKGFDAQYRVSYDRLFQCNALEKGFIVEYIPELYVFHPLYNYKSVIDIFKRGYYFNKWRVKLIKEKKPRLLSKNYAKINKILPILILFNIVFMYISSLLYGILIGLLMLIFIQIILVIILAYLLFKRYKAPLIYLPGILFVEIIKKSIGIYVYIFNIKPSYSYWKK